MANENGYEDVATPIHHLSIREQLELHCNCLPFERDEDNEMSDKDKKLFDRIIEQAISHISNITCWRNEFCSTFLMEQREEIIPITDLIPCGCGRGMMSFVPHYFVRKHSTVDIKSFEVEIVCISGLDEVFTLLEAKKFRWNKTLGELRMDLSDWIGHLHDCCPPELKARITYYAGYEQIPECLLDLFCDLLRILYELNQCDCKKCQRCTDPEPRDEEDLVYNDELAATIGDMLNRMIFQSYRLNLGLMSICKSKERWGYKV